MLPTQADYNVQFANALPSALLLGAGAHRLDDVTQYRDWRNPCAHCKTAERPQAGCPVPDFAAATAISNIWQAAKSLHCRKFVIVMYSCSPY